MPSMTKTRARAVPKSRISSPAGCPLAELSSTRGAGGRSPGGTARRGRCRGGCPTGPGSTRPTAEESEETALRRQDKRCVAAVERFAIGLQRAIKGEELRILPKRVGVDLDRAAIAIAPHPHIDDIDAKRLGLYGDLVANLPHDRGALIRQDVVQCDATEDPTQATG